MKTEPEHLFVYGTLMSRITRGIGGEQRNLLQTRAVLIGDATVAGRLFAFTSYPILLAVEDESERVHGEVWRLPDPTSLLPALDLYEGISPDGASSHEYQRVTRRAILHDGRTLDCWLYVYRGAVESARPVPGGRWDVG